jgi:hypothetical protein
VFTRNLYHIESGIRWIQRSLRKTNRKWLFFIQNLAARDICTIPIGWLYTAIIFEKMKFFEMEEMDPWRVGYDLTCKLV